MATQLERIAKRSGEDAKAEFRWLMPLCNAEALIGCFHALDGKKAVGIDGRTKEEYEGSLEDNIGKLIERMKQMAYRPAPVREVKIPKEGRPGEHRPLGISNIEDKMVQMWFARVLSAVYEPLFHDFSYGFRPKRNCHDAVKALRGHLFKAGATTVIDLDLKNYFGTIDHDKLVALLRMKIKDEVFIRYVIRMLKAGVLSDGGLTKSDEGTPQGSIVSPVLANIFAHYALDEWFKKTVKPRARSTVAMHRYCDDLVISCGDPREAERILDAMKARLERFGLTMNEEKTKLVSFSKAGRRRGVRQESFDFLGFTFFLAQSKTGAIIPKLKTSRKRYHSKLKRVKDWCKKNRHSGRMKELWFAFCAKLRGHVQYYGVTFNSRAVGNFLRRAIRIFFKWMNRRSQKRSMTWEKFNRFMEVFPPPQARIRHPMF